MDKNEILECLALAYSLGSNATKVVNFGRHGFTKTHVKQELASLNRIMKRLGFPKLTEDEYKKHFAN